jgi:outer membrane autotransporter protein
MCRGEYMWGGTRLGKRHAVVQTGVLAGAVLVALGLFGSAARAQNCGSNLITGTTQLLGHVLSAEALPGVSAALSANAAVSGALSAANGAFLTQSTAFVGGPGNPKPDSEGGGIWTRAVGGEMTLKSNSQVNVVADSTATASTTCNTQFHQTFGGYQLGMDIARFNVGGWNLTLGTTAGFLQTNGSVVSGDILISTQSGLNSTTQAPFIGTYGMATYGNFFFDGIVRGDYFQTNLNSPSSNFFNQKTEAHGLTMAGSAGYNWRVPNSSWFIEPSVGVIWSREAVDPISVSSPTFPSFGNTTAFSAANNNSTSGTVRLNDLESIIGRVGLRVGTTLETSDILYSPFAAVSVWHDFAGNSMANFSTCPGCAGPAAGAGEVANISSSNIGTFGQYSVGISGQLKNTGWLGFARVDYREGPEINGLSAAGGIRYQFTPTAAALPAKAKAPVDRPVNWSGWYGGLIGGATELGSASLTFPGVSTAQTRPSGWLGGGTLGYNFQSGKWVYGLEGDIAGTSTVGSTPCAPLAAHLTANTFMPIIPVALFNTTCHDSVDWIATATARLGYAWTPRSLVYVKAGSAFTDESASVTCNYGSPARNILEGSIGSGPCVDPAVTHLLDQASVRSFRAGWTVGLGTEFALTDHWSIKGEFDWLDFGTKSLTLSDGTPLNSKLQVAQAKIGLNYKFWPAGPDSAADLAVLPVIKVLPVKPAPATASTWDGFYLGASVGWEQTSSWWNTTCFTRNGNCGTGNPFFADASSPHTFETSGARIGVHFGNNWQVAPTWVVGVEADVGFNDKTSEATGVVGCTTSCGGFPGVAGHTPMFDSTSIRTSWDGSMRLRAGYLVTPWFLVYGTGGLAERMIDANVTCNGLFSPWCSNNENQTYAGHLQTGWTAGGGVEWKALNNVLLRGEYRYSDYGAWSPTFFATSADEIHTNISSHSHTALFGVSYLFNGTPVR